ncbi:hypothetical protein OG21DRAFT_1520308 [Imleria badia]|nr:hypothetical protein OG21DRAFT_1520308 [Imleria badia]
MPARPSNRVPSTSYGAARVAPPRSAPRPFIAFELENSCYQDSLTVSAQPGDTNDTDFLLCASPDLTHIGSFGQVSPFTQHGEHCIAYEPSSSLESFGRIQICAMLPGLVCGNMFMDTGEYSMPTLCTVGCSGLPTQNVCMELVERQARNSMTKTPPASQNGSKTYLRSAVDEAEVATTGYRHRQHVPRPRNVSAHRSRRPHDPGRRAGHPLAHTNGPIPRADETTNGQAVEAVSFERGQNTRSAQNGQNDPGSGTTVATMS